VQRVAARLRCSPAQVALAWALQVAPNILLIPGTASRTHLHENLGASRLRLDAEAVRDLNHLAVEQTNIGRPTEGTGASHDRGERLELENHRGISRKRVQRWRPFKGAPVVLVHARGRKSGHGYVNPMMYLQDDANDRVIYVFATKGGAPTHPDWYYNLTAAGEGSVERGTETYTVTVRDLEGAERDRIYAEQARRYPGFAEYERQTEGIRTIPVLEFTRVGA
jgi:deazaflavin-dependent oxidoreductase (nitroreductase family)